jgi:hypothetical protein
VKNWKSFIDLLFTFERIISAMFSKSVILNRLRLQMFLNDRLFGFNDIFKGLIDHFLSGPKLSLGL